MSNKKILYLTHDGLTDPLGESQILPYLTGLADRGFSITIISCEKKEAYRKGSFRVQDQCSRCKIRWIPLKYFTFPPVLAAAYNAYQIRSQTLKEFKRHRFQIVHCRSYLPAMVGLFLKSRFGVKFFFDMRGFWADERKESGLWPSYNPVFLLLYWYFKKIEKKLIKHSDHIVTLTFEAQKEIETWRISSSPVTVIPTCVDISLFDPDNISLADQIQLRNRLGISSSTYVLTYLGSWGTWYLIDEMLHFFQLLRKRVPESLFLVISNNPKEVVQLDGMIIVKATRLEVPIFLSLANASVFFIQPSFSKKGSAATKMAELLAMRIPIVTNAGWGDTNRLVFDHKGGFLVNDFSDASMNVAISQLLEAKHEESLRQIATAYFDLRKGIDEYNRIYSSLI